jgi:hypothetical protein
MQLQGGAPIIQDSVQAQKWFAMDPIRLQEVLAHDSVSAIVLDCGGCETGIADAMEPTGRDFLSRVPQVSVLLHADSQRLTVAAINGFGKLLALLQDSGHHLMAIRLHTCRAVPSNKCSNALGAAVGNLDYFLRAIQSRCCMQLLFALGPSELSRKTDVQIKAKPQKPPSPAQAASRHDEQPIMQPVQQPPQPRLPQHHLVQFWRADGMCGSPYLADENSENTVPAECDPASPAPCCSENGYCGKSAQHCSCEQCYDFRMKGKYADSCTAFGTRLDPNFQGKVAPLLQEPQIPKIIHQLWLGNRKAPPRWMKTCQRLYEGIGWEYILWTTELVTEKLGTRWKTYRQYQERHDFIGKADIVRYEIIQRYGGVYFDADTACLKSIDWLHQNIDTECWLSQEYRKWPSYAANGYIGCVKNSKLMKTINDKISRDNHINGHDAWIQVGPKMLNQLITTAGGSWAAGCNVLSVTVLSYCLFLPDHWYDLENKHLKSRHFSRLLAKKLELNDLLEIFRNEYSSSYTYQFWGSTFEADLAIAQHPPRKISGAPWLLNGRCGEVAPVQGQPGQCDPQSAVPCCSVSGWCGETPNHCDCVGCVDYRKRSRWVPPSTSAPAPAQPPAKQSHRLWLDSYACGPLHTVGQPPVPAQCDPKSDAPCCSSQGWCGASDLHCICDGCIDFRSKAEDAVNWHCPRFSAQSSQLRKGARIVISIPYRDREGQWTDFMHKFERFVCDSPDQHVSSWDVYLVEQFDAELFNRGWLFNVGLDISLKNASSHGMPEPTCGVIHDVDMIPHVGVDYSKCEWPIQLSSEIDRWGWSVAQPHYTGGVVSMSPKHWRMINGFPNDFFGWGGEDDDLMQRLNQNKLGLGVQTHLGKALARPAKHHGRFSSLREGHTLRIARSQSELTKHVEGIQKGGKEEKQRWKHDGLNTLRYTVIAEDVWTSRAVPIIDYHRVRVRRGEANNWKLREVRILVTSAICPQHPAGSPGAKLWWKFGESVPKTVAELRALIATKPLPDGCEASPGWTTKAGLAAVDLSWSYARLLKDDDEAVLPTFLRQLVDPSLGVIIVDHRGENELQAAFRERRRIAHSPEDPAFASPLTTLVCWGRASANEPQTVLVAPCVRPSDDWHWEGFLLAATSRRPGLHAHCIGRASSEKGPFTFQPGADCSGRARGQRWQHVATIFLPDEQFIKSGSLYPASPPSKVCVRTDSGRSELSVQEGEGDTCKGTASNALGLFAWDAVWATDQGALLLEGSSKKGCHLFVCSKLFLGHSGGRFVDDFESQGR